MNKTKYVAGILALSAALVACGGDYSRGDAIKDITEQLGVTEEQAGCIVDAAVDGGVSLDRMGSDDNPTAEEMETITAAFTECAG